MNRLTELLNLFASVMFAIGGLIYLFSDRPIEGVLWLILAKMYSRSVA